eukprot:TRINITY_DN5961_c0_g1_i1.p1 TRINITY_DN5961_c0_g1~~TRINITY_DN5961_c0_g1_i1.p1  ORF type:complete len:291 (-),score=40.48 TRINITY_DN5961_c0_g1_i1:152-1024(-)
MADDQIKGAMDVKLHPMVIVNLSDHYTREKVKGGASSKVRIYGLLLGQQSGRKVEISSSLEILVDDNKNIDHNFLKKRLSQFQRVFSHDEILGWYATGKSETYDLGLHQQIEQYNESPLFLLLDPDNKASQNLPISLLETTVKIVDDKPRIVFTKVPFSIETTEAERIAIDHVANVSTGGRSLLTSHLSTLQSAVKMLNTRVKIITRFVQDTNAGKIPRDEGLLRSINALCHLLPAIDIDKLQEDFLTEYNDALLVTYLATITKTSNAINEMIEKFNITYDRHTRRRGFY